MRRITVICFAALALFLALGAGPTPAADGFGQSRQFRSGSRFSAIYSDLLPSTDDQYTLGSGSKRWRELHVSRDATIGGTATASVLAAPAIASADGTPVATLTADDLRFLGDLRIAGTAYLEDALDVTGLSTLRASVGVTGDVTASGGIYAALASITGDVGCGSLTSSGLVHGHGVSSTGDVTATGDLYGTDAVLSGELQAARLASVGGTDVATFDGANARFLGSFRAALGLYAEDLLDVTGLSTLRGSAAVTGYVTATTTLGADRAGIGVAAPAVSGQLDVGAFIDTPDIETATVSARDGTTALTLTNATGAVAAAGPLTATLGVRTGASYGIGVGTTEPTTHAVDFAENGNINTRTMGAGLGGVGFKSGVFYFRSSAGAADIHATTVYGSTIGASAKATAVMESSVFRDYDADGHLTLAMSNGFGIIARDAGGGGATRASLTTGIAGSSVMLALTDDTSTGTFTYGQLASVLDWDRGFRVTGLLETIAGLSTSDNRGISIGNGWAFPQQRNSIAFADIGPAFVLAETNKGEVQYDLESTSFGLRSAAGYASLNAGNLVASGTVTGTTYYGNIYGSVAGGGTGFYATSGADMENRANNGFGWVLLATASGTDHMRASTGPLGDDVHVDYVDKDGSGRQSYDGGADRFVFSNVAYVEAPAFLATAMYSTGYYGATAALPVIFPKASVTVPSSAPPMEAATSPGCEWITTDSPAAVDVAYMASGAPAAANAVYKFLAGLWHTMTQAD